jgi:alpha-ketoglutarate-dependent taurine dioxygenase
VVAAPLRSPLPFMLLSPSDFALDACRGVMARVGEILRDGVMFAVVDRLPVEEWTRDEALAAYWVLSSLLARPVPQKLNGQMLFDVRDTGAKLKPGSGIRPTVTNVDLTFHNDNSYNETPPEVVALLCQQTAKAGGVSRVMSVHTVHNALLEGHEAVLPRLYRPFWYDRHAEHEPDDATTYAAPVFEWGERLMARLAISEIKAGYALRGEPMDGETQAAIDAVLSVFDRPELRVELDFRPGQIQYVNNRGTGHARTEFEDWPDEERKRHLVRLWLRDKGRRGYRG